MTEPSDLLRRIEAWIRAGRIFESDASIELPCPECGKGVLLVKDESSSDGMNVDRSLSCSEDRINHRIIWRLASYGEETSASQALC